MVLKVDGGYRFLVTNVTNNNRTEMIFARIESYDSWLLFDAKNYFRAFSIDHVVDVKSQRTTSTKRTNLSSKKGIKVCKSI